jgi:hypothetical protein
MVWTCASLLLAILVRSTGTGSAPRAPQGVPPCLRGWAGGGPAPAADARTGEPPGEAPVTGAIREVAGVVGDVPALLRQQGDLVREPLAQPVEGALRLGTPVGRLRAREAPREPRGLRRGPRGRHRRAAGGPRSACRRGAVSAPRGRGWPRSCRAPRAPRLGEEVGPDRLMRASSSPYISCSRAIIARVCTRRAGGSARIRSSARPSAAMPSRVQSI